MAGADFFKLAQGLIYPALNGFGVGVFLQVGYSFLIGCVCALTTLFTGNIFSAIAVHSLFDVGGFLFEEFGAGTLWTTSNIVVTAIVSVVCAAALIVGFFKVDSDWVYEKLRLNEKPRENN